MTPQAAGRVLIIVPAWNEEAAIGRVVQDIQRDVPEVPVLVIDDCSSDNTLAVAREAGAQVLPLPHHLGLGGCVQAGVGSTNVALTVDSSHPDLGDGLNETTFYVRSNGDHEETPEDEASAEEASAAEGKKREDEDASSSTDEKAKAEDKAAEKEPAKEPADEKKAAPAKEPADEKKAAPAKEPIRLGPAGTGAGWTRKLVLDVP